MRDKAIIPSSSPAIRNGVLVLHGYGVRVKVDRGHLVVSDGFCEERRWMRLHKATSGLRRLIILGHSGILTLEALRWISDAGAAVGAIDLDGRVLLASGSAALDDARLRRAQALAASNDTGVRITREIIRRKLRGQLSLLESLSVPTVAELNRAIENIDGAATLNSLRSIEAWFAAAYWEAWKSVQVMFARRDEQSVPEHWKTFGTRSSPLTGQPRLAANPANSILNYLYAVLETEARIACEVMGLDVGMAILHADQPGRASLALDVMEEVRPQVDMFLLDMLRARVFSKDDFTEDRRGVCRVLPPLTQALAETSIRWRRAVAPVVERVGHLLAESRVKTRHLGRSLSTPLTQANRSAGRDAVRRRPPRGGASLRFRMPLACRICGVILNGRHRVVCDDCLPTWQTDVIRAGTNKAVDALRRLRNIGRDPAHSRAALRAQEERRARHREQARGWNQGHPGPHDPDEFKRTILPLLSHVPLGQLARATGLSKAYLSFVRRGIYVPHPRHWEALNALSREIGESM